MTISYVVEEPHALLPSNQTIINSIEAKLESQIQQIVDLLLSLSMRHLSNFRGCLRGQQRPRCLPLGNELRAFGRR